MAGKHQFPEETLQLLRKARGLRIRAGRGQHRFIGIWFVLVNDRVFVRSWSVKPNGWYRAFLKDPSGAIQLGDRKISVHARRTRSLSFKAAIDRAYLDKYNTKGALKYAKDLGSAKSRATTLELVASAF